MSTETTRQLVDVIADPGAPTAVAQKLIKRFLSNGSTQNTDYRLTTERLAIDEFGAIDVPAVARRVLPASSGDLVILISDQPRHTGDDSIAIDILPGESAVLISLPTFGAFRTTAKLYRVVHELTSGSISETVPAEPSFSLPSTVADLRAVSNNTATHRTVSYVRSGIGGRIATVAGLVKDNRPWRLLPKLKSAAAAAAATSGYLMLMPTAWQLATNLTTVQLLLCPMFAIAIMSTWLIFTHGMWDSVRSSATRRLTSSYNLATVVTVLFGIASIYALVFVVSLAGLALVTTPNVVSRNIEDSVHAIDWLKIASFVGSIATFAGGIGATLESDETVREAAYGYRQRLRLRSDKDNDQ